MRKLIRESRKEIVVIGACVLIVITAAVLAQWLMPAKGVLMG